MTPDRRNDNATGLARNQQGFTLLEVLVTVVVVSIGLLGILGLQTASLINARISASRSAAVIAADNVAARMRANPNADYDNLQSYTDVSTVPAGLPDCSAGSGNNCSRGQILQVARWRWSETLRRTLPNGRGFVDCTASACERYSITIVWDEHDPLTDHDNSSSSSSTDLCSVGPRADSITDRCFVTEVRL